MTSSYFAHTHFSQMLADADIDVAGIEQAKSESPDETAVSASAILESNSSTEDLGKHGESESDPSSATLARSAEVDEENKILHFWSRDEVKMLLNEYKERWVVFNDPKTRKLDIWACIATKIEATFRSPLSARQCHDKFRLLKAQFRKVYNSPSGTKSCQYYDDLYDIFGDTLAADPSVSAMPGYSGASAVSSGKRKALQYDPDLEQQFSTDDVDIEVINGVADHAGHLSKHMKGDGESDRTTASVLQQIEYLLAVKVDADEKRFAEQLNIQKAQLKMQQESLDIQREQTQYMKNFLAGFLQCCMQTVEILKKK